MSLRLFRAVLAEIFHVGYRLPYQVLWGATMCLIFIFASEQTLAQTPEIFIERGGRISIDAEHTPDSLAIRNGWAIGNYYTGKSLRARNDSSGSATGKAAGKKTEPSPMYIIRLSEPATYTLHWLSAKRFGSVAAESQVEITWQSENGDVQRRTFSPPNYAALRWHALDEHHQPCRITFPARGDYRITLTPKKGDGFYIDKLIFSRDEKFKPTGVGDDETALNAPPASEQKIVLPPAWAFGVMYGGYTNQRETLDAIDSLIQIGAPVDAYWIDSWFWDYQTRGKGPKGYLNFTGDTAAFPDMKAMWNAAHQRHIKNGIWVWNGILRTGNESVFDEFKANTFFSKVYLEKNRWHNSTGNTEMGDVNFSNPAAARAWQKRLAPFFEQGLDFLKLDRTSDLDYCETAFRATAQRRTGDMQRGFILAHLHTTYDKRHKQFPTKWSGDAKMAWTQNEYPDNRIYAMGGLKENVEMLADPHRTTYEIPFLTCDGGGYDYFGSTEQTDELYIRWAQFSLMTPITTFFSTANNPTRNHPYRYPESTQRIFNHYAHLKQQLFPYIYTQALRAHLTGKKVISGDGEHLGQYLLGDDLLIAPVTQSGATSQRVFLPSGNWIDFHTETRYVGNQTVTVATPIDIMPMFLREGALLPMRRYARAIELGTNDSLILKIYPATNPTVTPLLEDDGISTQYADGKIAETEMRCVKQKKSIRITIEPVKGTYVGMKSVRHYEFHIYTDQSPRTVRVNNQRVAAWSYQGKILTVPVTANKDKQLTLQIITR
jgi:hypothetical protein